jgi:hypothetical protein
MFESKLNKGKNGGYAPLNGQGIVPIENSQPTVSGGTYSGGSLTLNRIDGSNVEITGFNSGSAGNGGPISVYGTT